MAFQGPSGELDDHAIGVKARDGALAGEAHFVQAPVADAFIVAAHGTAGIELHWVPRDASGLTIHAAALVDGSQSARLELRGVRADPIVAAPAGGLVLRDAIDHAAVATAAELVGLMERALELTLDYLRTRKQFGKPIGSFQALQHRVVDLWIAKEMSRAALNAAIARLNDPQADAVSRSAAASGARARAAQSAFALCNQSIQLHGAIGFTDEYDLGLLVNRALALCAWPGDAQVHRRRFASARAEVPA
ncbi:MAG: acyl-CoA dehydrogenase [Burkholderiales bacterium]